MASISSTGRPSGSRALLPLRLTLIAVALSALAAYPAYRLDGWSGLQSMLLGAGLSLLTIVLSYLVLAFAFRNAKQLQMIIVVGGFVVRVAMLFGFLGLISRTLRVDLNQLIIWLVSFYLVLVIAEAFQLASETRSRPSLED